MDFLELDPGSVLRHSRPSRRGRGRFFWGRRSKIIVGIASAILVALGVIALLLAPPILDAYGKAQAGKQRLQEAQTLLLEQQEYQEAHAKLAQAKESFTAATRALERIPRPIASLPFLAPQLAAASELLGAGVDVTGAVERLGSLLIEATSPLRGNGEKALADMSREERQAIFKAIVESPPILAQVQGVVELAKVRVERAREGPLLAPLESTLATFHEKVTELVEGLEQAQKLAELLPPLAGYPQALTYLFLLQNNAELRPTGGFLGAYGILKVKDGEIVEFRTDNSYNLDVQVQDTLNVTPPVPLTKYNKVEKWFLRDSNWSPDFPTAAQQALWFYGKEGGNEKADAVIAITPTVLEELLTFFGSLTVDGVNFTPENARDTLIYEVARGYLQRGESFRERKEIIGDLGRALVDRILRAPKREWPKLFTILQAMLGQKHMLVWTQAESLQEKILASGWGGEVKAFPEGEDELLVVDANLASLKTDRVMERRISYQVHQEGESLIADLTITYKNNAQEVDDFTTRYRTYTRVYAPKGSILISQVGSMANDRTTKKGTVDISEEFDRTVFGTFIAIEPKEERTLHFIYQLPSVVKETAKDGSTYRLHVSKQPGTSGHRLEVRADLGAPAKAFTPLDKGKKTADTQVEFAWDLREDRVFTLQL